MRVKREKIIESDEKKKIKERYERERENINEIDKKERGVKMKREKEKNQLKQQINIKGEIKIKK